MQRSRLLHTEDLNLRGDILKKNEYLHYNQVEIPCIQSADLTYRPAPLKDPDLIRYQEIRRKGMDFTQKGMMILKLLVSALFCYVSFSPACIGAILFLDRCAQCQNCC